MLEIKSITKIYDTNGFRQEALHNVSINFRDHEFTSILGQSGSGKTTLLNIIGGLDQYSSGDLIINGVSTKDYKDRDWDTYRNHKIGFIFQNYNLISHQSVLTNVELALTLSGVSKKERKQRAIDALKKVGLGEHIKKKPNQLSGGQMQRVAIARALVNDPDIILADEPTGALDSETAIQVMSIIKEISKDKLIIMVTHNPEIAEQYSSRIIKLKDGVVLDDSNPYTKEEMTKDIQKKETDSQNQRKTSMGLKTALSLSFKNLMSKKGRTILTSVAGSIGIIGIAAILALSNGVQNYIDKVEEDTLSSYPITIEKATFDMTSVMQSILGSDTNDKTYVDRDTIYVRPIVNDILGTVSSQMKVNNLTDFKKYLESEDSGVKNYINGIQYSYGFDINIYKENDSKDGYILTNPNDIVSSIGFSDFTGNSNQYGGVEMLASSSIWSELLDNQELLDAQYDVLSGRWPEKYNEVVITVDQNNQINDYILYSLGLRNQDEITNLFTQIQLGQKVEMKQGEELSYDDLIGQSFKLVLNSDYYVKENGIWVDKSTDKEFIRNLLKTAEEIKIVGIIRPNENTTTTAIPGSIAYTSALEEYVIKSIQESEIVKEQKSNPNINVFTGLEFSKNNEQFDINNLTPEQQQYIATLTPQQLATLMENYKQNANATYEKNLSKLGVVDIESPATISIYAKDFESKEKIVAAIEKYNKNMKEHGQEENTITYVDMVGVMISSISDIVDTVSYVLIAFVSISLIVSSIMIGIITYISVLERTKEIGILRAMGASKKDIGRVFNAETFIIGLTSGCFGILITQIITIPANIIIKNLTGVSNIANLPLLPAMILILISVFLTIFAGLIPSKIASNKNPVEALRTE